MPEAIILSDLHLGSGMCLAKVLLRVLEQNRDCAIILNGDTFDSFDFRGLRKSHRKALAALRRRQAVFVSGNHDGSSKRLSDVLGVEAVDHHILESGGERILIVHGHKFDDFLEKHPFLTWTGDLIYNVLQRIQPSHRMARFVKRESKDFLDIHRKVKYGAIAMMKKLGCTQVCCGHTHYPYTWHPYYNSGSFTDNPCTYLTVDNGLIKLEEVCP